MAIQAIGTMGMTVKYAPEATAGTRPTTGYTELPGVKALPALGDDVNTLQTTPLSATKNHTYIPGLADSGGALQLTVNDAPAFRDAYDTMYTAYTTAVAAGNGFWLEYVYPSEASMDSFYIPVQLAPLGFGGAEVDSVLENMVNIIPSGDYVYAAASTSA